MTNGHMTNHFTSTNTSGSFRVFAFYERLTGAKNLDPQKNASRNIFDNGCYIVDHFDPRGARVITKFWEDYVLVDGIKDLLQEVGNSGMMLPFSPR